MKQIHEVQEITQSDGEKTTKTVKSSSYRVENQDDYIKLYIKTMSVIHDVPKPAVPVLTELLQLVTYDNRIILNGSIRKEIADRLGMIPNTLTRKLADLCESKLIFKHGTNTYRINTYVFGRGRWEEIRQNRESLPVHLKFVEGAVIFEDIDNEDE